MESKIATIDDWKELYAFYEKVYPVNHPLKNIDFWKWQYGNHAHGSAYIVRDEHAVYGHVGAYFNGGLAWIINVYLDEVLRGQGWLGKLYDMAREDYTHLAATSANAAGLGLYRNMGWIRYADLERYILINPVYAHLPIKEILTQTEISTILTQPTDNYYWQEPGITGALLEDGSTGVAQTQVGGFRFAELLETEKALEQIWGMGFKWCDYLSSWNDKKHTELARKGWAQHHEIEFPWYMNPIDYQKKCKVTFLTEGNVDNTFLCKRYYSDHGRVGSLPNKFN